MVEYYITGIFYLFGFGNYRLIWLEKSTFNEIAVFLFVLYLLYLNTIITYKYKKE